MRIQIFRIGRIKIGLSGVPRVTVRHLHSDLTDQQTKWQLRDYQEECIANCFDALNRGVTRIGVSLPIGSGKTTIFAALLHQMPFNVMRPNATRGLILVNSIQIADQTANRVREMFPNTTVETDQGTEVATGDADITVATYQSLRDRLDKFSPDRIKAVVVDEAHHAVAKSYVSILSHFDPRISEETTAQTLSPPVPIIGYSATFSRHDKLSLETVFEELVYRKELLEMMQEGWVRFTTVVEDIGLESADRAEDSDFTTADVAMAMNTDDLNAAIAQTWQEKAIGRKSTLIFCADLKHVRGVASEFRKRKIDARFAFGGMTGKERRELRDGFLSGSFPVLVNCGVYLEGADFPNIDCVMVARPTRSKNLFTQMIGRGLRHSPQTGKLDCHVIDFVDSQREMDDMFSASSLFQLDPRVPVNDLTFNEMLNKAKRFSVGPRTGKSSRDSQRIISLTNSNRDCVNRFSSEYHFKQQSAILEMSPFGWVYTRHDGCYKLRCWGRGLLVLTPCSGGWRLNYLPVETIPSLKKLVGKAAEVPASEVEEIIEELQTLDSKPDLLEIVKEADKFASNRLMGGETWGLKRNRNRLRDPSLPWQHNRISLKLGICPESGCSYLEPEKAHMRSWLGVLDQVALHNLRVGEAYDVMLQLWGKWTERRFFKASDKLAPS